VPEEVLGTGEAIFEKGPLADTTVLRPAPGGAPSALLKIPRSVRKSAIRDSRPEDGVGGAAGEGRVSSSRERVSYASRLTFSRCCGPMLSEVMLLPREPQPKVIEGKRLVV
jgi:hypothetical protein